MTPKPQQILQKIFEREIQDKWSFHRVALKLIQEKLQQSGINLTPSQIETLEAKLKMHEGDTLNFKVDLDEKQTPTVSGTPGKEPLEELKIDLGDTHPSLHRMMGEFNENLSRRIPEIVAIQSALLVKHLKRNATKINKRRKKERTSFESRLARRWRKGLGLLDTFITVSLEAGVDFNNEFRTASSRERDFVIDVLTRLHARACQVASEILTLLKSGYADGAHARWRSLHEITVVGMVVSSSGNETAERYLLHDGVESYKAARLYQEHYEKLGYEPMTEEEIAKIEANYRVLLERFGDSYRHDFGWAATTLNEKQPTFRHLENYAQLRHLRPFYKMASHNVHANPKGVFFKLGLYPAGEEVLLAGPSNTGLTDPADGTVVSLGQITVTLLATRPNIDRLVICEALLRLGKEVGETFLEIQRALENQPDK